MKIIDCILMVLLLCTGFPPLWRYALVRSCIISNYGDFKNVLPMYSHYKTPDIWQLGKNDFERFGHVSKMLDTLPEQKTSECISELIPGQSVRTKELRIVFGFYRKIFRNRSTSPLGYFNNRRM
jgi:hypothetical protein